MPLLDFADQLRTTLEEHELESERLMIRDRSPFSWLRFHETSILLHCVDISTYIQFQQQNAPRLFFQRLSEQFSAEGVSLIHVWEDVWQQNPMVVISRLNALAGRSQRIPARLTQARRIDRSTAEEFLNKHHLQAFTTVKYKYGLFLPERYFRVLSSAFRQQHIAPNETELLVSVATFSYPRHIERVGELYRSTELVRFAHHIDSTVVGGLDKLLQAFIHDHHPDDIMTYADRDWSDGHSYITLGFTYQKLTEPQQFWLRLREWIRYYPHRLPKDLSEAELPANGYIPIYNAGSSKFIKQLNQ